MREDILRDHLQVPLRETASRCAQNKSFLSWR